MVQFLGLREDSSSRVLNQPQLSDLFLYGPVKHIIKAVESTEDELKFCQILLRHKSFNPPYVLEVIVG